MKRAPGSEPKNPERKAGFALRAAAFAVAVLEVGFSALLGLLSFNLPPVGAIGCGVLFSLAICLVCAAAWRSLIVVDPECPDKALRRLRNQLKIVAPLWAVALLGALLIGRIVTVSTASGTAAFVTLLSVLSVFGPMLSAICLLLADQICWAQVYCDLYRKLEELENAVDRLTAECDAAERRLPGGSAKSDPPSDDDEPSSGQTGAAPAAIAAAVLIALCCGAARATECGSVWLDKSGSQNTVESQQAANTALGLLPEWSETSGCRTWNLYAFAGSPFTDVSFFPVALPKAPGGICTAQAARRELDAVFRGPAEAAAKERQTACDTQRTDESQKYRTAVEEQLKQAQARTSSAAPAAPGKTCIVDLLKRLADSPGLSRSLVITDGAETCVPSFRGKVAAPPATRVTMVVISQQRPPKAAASAADYFEIIKARWMEVAPWVNIVPVYKLDAAVFTPDHP